MFYVYIHRRATDGVIFYVGKGWGRRAYSTKDRNKHWRNIDAKHGRIMEFVGSHLAESEAFELECFLIEFIGRNDLGLGHLVNMTDGGDGHAGYQQTPEAVEARISKIRGMKRTDEQRARMSEATRGRPKSIAHRESIRRTMQSREVSQAFRLAGIAALKGHVVTPETRARIREGCPHLRAVMCVETGDVFNSLADAAKWLVERGNLKATPSAVSLAYRKGKKVYGYTWVKHEHD